MANFLWLIPAVILFITLLVLLVVLIKKKELIGAPNYRAIFWLGVALAAIYPLNLLLKPIEGGGSLYIMPALGIVYLIVGLFNKDKWGKQNGPTVSPLQRKIMIGLSFVALALFLLGLAFVLLNAR